MIMISGDAVKGLQLDILSKETLTLGYGKAYGS